mgnify:CR=1 FL=1
MGSKHKVMKPQLFFLVATIIIIAGFFVRIFWIEKSPPSLNWDEVSLGYNAYSILKTGKDEFGTSWPLVLRSFDDYKPALYSYLTIPFVKFYGLNEFSTRIVSVLSGTAIIIAAMLLAYYFFRRKLISLIVGFLVAFSPWAIHFSRAAFEANLGLALFLLGLSFMFFGLKNRLLLPIGVFLAGLSMHSYIAYKLITPFMLTAFIYISRKELLKIKTHVISVAFALALVVIPLLILHITNSSAASRLETTTLFTANKSPDVLIQQFIAHYLSYFSPANLFVRGSPEPTQQIPGFGILYPIEIVFFFLGIWYLFNHLKDCRNFIIILLILPIPAAMTWNWFYPARVLPLFVFFNIISAVGAAEIIRWTMKQNVLVKIILPTTVFVLLTTEILSLFTTLLFYLPYKEGGNWQSGMKEILTEITKYQNDYSHIVIETRTAQPHIFTLFYTQYDPNLYHKNIADMGGIPIPRKNFNFGKFEFRDVYWPTDQYDRDVLLISPESSLPIEKVSQNANLKTLVIVKDKWGNTLAHIAGIK